MKMISNFILFQIGWFSVVLSAASGQAYIGSLIIAAIIVFHLFTTKHRSNEIILIVLTLIVGLIWDSLMSMSGLFIYESGILLAQIAPYWILAMWALFATTINYSMSWIKGRIRIAMIAGAVFGPLSYYAGYKLGAVDIPDLTRAMFAQSLGWAVILPVLGIAADLVNCDCKALLRSKTS